MFLNYLYTSSLYREMDESYAKIRNETDNMTECIAEVVQARKVHKNFKDEAARIRVHHKTNIIAADMYEAAYIDIQVTKLILLNKRMSEFHVCVVGVVLAYARECMRMCVTIQTSTNRHLRELCVCAHAGVCMYPRTYENACICVCIISRVARTNLLNILTHLLNKLRHIVS